MSSDDNKPFEHQDWKPVIIGKKNASSSSKPKPKTQQPIKRIQEALVDDGSPNRVEKIDKRISQNIQNARTNANLTRKQLAQKINEKETLVAEYENGTAIPNPNILNKIDNVLKSKVRVIK